jgi:hypothetical protein
LKAVTERSRLSKQWRNRGGRQKPMALPEVVIECRQSAIEVGAAAKAKEMVSQRPKASTSDSQGGRGVVTVAKGNLMCILKAISEIKRDNASLTW